MTTVAHPTDAHDANTRWYLDLMIDGMKPANRPDVGRWLPLVEMAESAYESSSNGNRGQIVKNLLTNLLENNKRAQNYPGLEAMLSGTEPVPSVAKSPQATEVEPGNETTMPELPESARVPAEMSAGSAFLMERYIEYSKLVSPEGFDDFHPDTFLWILSTIAGRRLKIPF